MAYSYGPRRRSTSPSDDEPGRPQFPQSPAGTFQYPSEPQGPPSFPHPPTEPGGRWQYGAHSPEGPPPNMPVAHSPVSALPGVGGFAPPPGPPPPVGFPAAAVQDGTAPPAFPEHDAARGFFTPHAPGSPHSPRSPKSPRSPPPPSSPPPGYTAPPPSGYRIPLSTSSAFPPSSATHAPVCFDADGRSPVFLGSAIFPKAVHPCKVAPHLVPPCRVPYGGREYEHRGRYDLLPFDPSLIEWVPTANGKVPQGRRPVEGGYEENGAKLYHALAAVGGVQVPGKTGEHLNGCNVAFGGAEHVVTSGYRILCWK